MQVALLIVQIIVAVLIAFYAWQVKRSVDKMDEQREEMSKQSKEMAEQRQEMRRHRIALFKPVVISEEVTPGSSETVVYVEDIMNIGKGPAFNVRMRIQGAKYEMEGWECKVLSEKRREPDRSIPAPKEGKRKEPFELKDGVERGAVIFTYEDIEKHKLESRIEFWKEEGEWKSEVMWAGKWV